MADGRDGGDAWTLASDDVADDGANVGQRYEHGKECQNRSFIAVDCSGITMGSAVFGSLWEQFGYDRTSKCTRESQGGGKGILWSKM